MAVELVVGETTSEVIEVIGGPPGPAGPAAVSPSAFELRGTGSPEGVVTASVGTYYTDTNATNGAIRWVKASGTGNGGWKVMYGDTGTRNVTSMAATNVTLTMSFWSRIGNIVQASIIIRANAALPSGSLVFTAPSGFRPTVTANLSPPYSGTGPLTVNTSGTAVLWVPLAAGGERAWTVNWMTRDPWPTTLPGTAV